MPGTYISPAETGLYYLNSRYYDPVVGRFVNADSRFDINAGLLLGNLFIYCANNPVIYQDNSGESLLAALGIGALVGGIVSAAISIGSQLLFEGNVSAEAVVIDAISGAASGALAATGIGAFGQMVGNALINAGGYLASERENATWEGLAVSGTIGFAAGAIGGPGIDLNTQMGIAATARSVIKSSSSARKVAMYSAKITLTQKVVKGGLMSLGKSSVFGNIVNRMWPMISEGIARGMTE